MSKRLLTLVFSLLVGASMAYGAGKAMYGTVSDSNCGAKHAMASKDAEACVEKCVTGGAKYTLVSKGKVYQLDAQDKFKGMGGTRVKVTGTVSGDSITVESVEAAGGKMTTKKDKSS
jgi:uncharacterized protein DUF5818